MKHTQPPTRTGDARTDQPDKHDTSTSSHQTTSIAQHNQISPTSTSTPPPGWPANITYLSQPRLSPYLSPAQLRWLRTKTVASTTEKEEVLPVIKLPVNREEQEACIRIELIADDKHPAFNQRGLFATRNLQPGECIVPYLGYVHSSTLSERAEYERRKAGVDTSTEGAAATKTLHAAPTTAAPDSASAVFDQALPPAPAQAPGSWDSSDYDLNMIRADDGLELAVDAQSMGNEARFTNDYRGVPSQVGAESGFSDRRLKRQVKHAPTGNEGRGGWVYKDEQAVPNAEFRDVWFEMSDGGEFDTAVEGLGGRLAFLNVGEKENDDGGGSGETQRAQNAECSSGSKIRIKSKKRRKNGIRGIAIFVLPAGRAGKRKDGIRKGQEVLVSYGKGFWAHRGGPD